MAEDKPESSKDGASTNIDSNFSYYIHSSEYPMQMHIYDVQTDNNYNNWAHEMTIFLFAKNKIGFINGTNDKLDAESETYMSWM